MKRLKLGLKYAVYALLLPLIFLAIVCTFAVVMMDWYVEQIQWMLDGVDEACA